MKKTFAILLALIMVLSLATTAFAAGTDTITVNGTVKDETYTIYKMMDVTVDDPANPTAYKYTVATEWVDFFTTGAGKDYVNIDGTDGHVTWKDGMDTEAKMIEFAQKAAAYAAGKTGIVQVATGTSVEFTGLDHGYYLVTSTLGTKAMVETTPRDSAVSISEKNPVDTIEKKVQEDSNSAWVDSNDAQVGQTVNFKSTATLQPYTRNVKIHDTMDAGLTYNNDVVIEGLTAGVDYIVLDTPDAGDTFTIQFTEAYLESLTATTILTVTYSAVLNEKAIVTDSTGTAIVDQDNKTTITYGDKQSVESETTTTTHSFSVYKHAAGQDDNLAGAKFSLKVGTEVVKLIKIDDNNYRVANGDEEGAITEFVTVEEGDIVIWGVDADTYYLTENEAPAGYNKLSADVEVKVDAGTAYRADIANNSGSTLPSTGGVGTTMFYVFGSMMVVGAAVVLVTKKRMTAAE